jgi:Flp pilus assembly pilin Flp
MVEYAVLVGAVGIAGAFGLVLVGAAVARNFEFVRSMLLSPIP